ncbi:MAG: bacillithiol biosynthesis BshC [Planctomycetota bacterium]|nr:bacillithiol biosynthesis BshC [Planctomycetota bacterium]
MTGYDSHPLLALLRGADSETLSSLGLVDTRSVELIDQLAHRNPDPQRRQVLLEVLAPKWQRLELSPSARQAVRRLEDPRTRIVLAGQQPALWGGPVMILSKVLALLTLARQMESAGIPTVPIFWIADDDHDQSELDCGHFLSGEDPGHQFPPGRRPIFDLHHPEKPQQRLAALQGAIGAAPHAEAVVRLASNSLESTPAAEFVSLLGQLLPESTLLPILPRWLRTLQQPLISQLLGDVDRYRGQIQNAIDHQLQLGIPAPVPAPRGMPLFVIDDEGQRRRPEELNLSVEEVLAYDPQRISPDALMRTIVQDQLMDPAAVILGPTELCYAIETREVRRSGGYSTPLWLPRPRLRPICSTLLERLAAQGVKRDDVQPTADAVDLVPSPLAARKAQEISEQGTALIDEIEKVGSSPDATPALRRRSQRLVKKWRQQLAQLESSVEGGLGLGVEASRQRVRALLEEAFPGGQEPERSRNILDLLAHQGLAVIDRMMHAMESVEEPWDGGILVFEENPHLKQENQDASS